MRRCSGRSRCGWPRCTRRSWPTSGARRDFLRKALALPGDEAPVLASLELSCARQGENAELAEILAREAEVAADPDAAGRLPGGAGRGPPGARSRTPTARWPPTATRSSATPTTRARARRCTTLLDRAETREGALDVLEPLAQARGDFDELLGAVRAAPGAARRPRRARALAAQDRRGRRRSARQPGAGARRARAARWTKSRCRARRSTISSASRARPSCRASGAARSRRRIGGRRSGRRARAGAARRAALRATAGDAAAAERLYAAGAGGRRRERRRAARRWRAATARRATSSALAAILERARRGRAGSAGAASAADGGGAACTSAAARGIPDAIAALQKLRAGGRGRRRGAGRAGAPARGGRQRAGAGRRRSASGRASPRTRAPARRCGRASASCASGMLNDLDGAAEAYREALEGAPDDPIALSALESIEERREDWSTLQEVLMRRLGATFGADQVAVLLKLARNAEQKLSRRSTRRSASCARSSTSTRRNAFAYLELERLLRASERWYDLVEVLAKHADAEGRGGPPAGGAGAAGRDRRRLGEGARLARERRRGAGEGAGGRADERGGAAVAGAPARGRRALGRGRRGAGARGRQRLGAGARSPRSSSATRRSCAARSRPEEIEARCCGRWSATRPTGRRWRRWRRWRATAKDDERLVQLLELGLEAATRRRRAASACSREIAALYTGPLGIRAAALPHLERLVALDPKEITPREELAEALIAARAASTRRRAAMLRDRRPADQGAPGQGRGPLPQRLGCSPRAAAI